jgi:uncharacterized protein YjiS (DUF1127 family)
MSRSTVEFPPSRAAGLAAASLRTVLIESIWRRIDWIRSEYRFRRDINALMALDDRMLADIGLRRGEIEHAVRFSALPRRRNELL